MLLQYLKLIRIPQWIKNFFVFVPLVFSQHLFDQSYFLTSLSAFFVFCLISSLVYITNDIVDAEADRLHPVKKNRPIASGKIPVGAAITLAAVLFFAIVILLPAFNNKFILAAVLYLVLNVFYTFLFKHKVLLDIFSIAAGFMIRIVAGAYVIDVPISSWLILTTMFVSLFLAIMKRYSELQTISEANTGSTRKVLAYYSLNFTEQMATVAAAGVIICYALYTVSARTVDVFNTENLIFTTPFVVYGIFRYMYLVYMNKKGENTTEIMLTDVSLIVNIFLYLTITTLIIYDVF
jgi:decaprenyl-phosphate phosphoribosyltransferase